MIRFAAVLAVLLLAACGASPGLQETPPSWGNPFVGREYRVVHVRENGTLRPLVRGTSPVLRFGNDETISLWAGCNRIGGPATVEPDRLRADELQTTDLGCRDDRAAQDRWFSALLTAGVAWESAGNDLILISGGTQIRLRLVVLEAPPLVGTWWRVVEINRSVPGSVDPPRRPEALTTRVPSSVDAWLMFDGRRVTGSTGCNRFSGSAVVADSTVTPRPLVTTKRACTGGAAAVERALLTLFGNPYFGWGPNRRTVSLDYGGTGVTLG